MFDLPALGHRIQQARVVNGLTLQALADRADVSVGMLSSVERGLKSPTIVVLARIAHGLGVPLTDLVAEPEAHRVVVRRAPDQDTIDEPGGWHRVVVSPVIPGVNFEWIRVTLPPGCDAGTYPAYAPGSHEFILIDAGTLTLTIAEQELTLSPGDSLYFASDVPHAYRNDGPEVCAYHVAALIMRPRR